MKPIIILPPNTMSAEDIQILRDNDLCVVVAEDPARVKCIDPLPSISSRTEIESAAIQLSRKIMAPGFWNNDETRKTVAQKYVDILVKGTSLDPEPSQDEREKKAYDVARIEEMQKIAREDARAEAAEKRAARAAAKQKK